MWGDLRELARWIDRGDRLRWLLLVPLAAMAALVGAAGALAVFGLLRLVVDPGRLPTTPGLRDLWALWPEGDVRTFLAALTVGVAVFYVLRALFLAWVEWLKESVVHQSGARAAEHLYSRYLAADYAFHLRRRSASLIEEVARSTDAAFQLIAASVLNIFAELATLAAMIAVLVTTAPARTLIAVAIVLVVVGVPILASRRTWVRWGGRNKQFEEQQLHVLQQSLGAVKELKIAGQESFFESRLRLTRRELAHVRRQRAVLASGLRLAVETVLIVSMLAVVLMVTLRGASGADTLSLLALFAYVGFRAVPSANRIMLNAGYLREGQPFAHAVARDFAALSAPTERQRAAEPGFEFSDSIACDRVTFVYEDGGRPALEDVSIRIRRGELIGVVGATGSGKSTLVDLLLGLLRPTSGRVLIDERDLRGHERGWQRLVGYVPQDPYLLDDSLRSNIAFAVPDSIVDDQRLARACSLAQLDDFVKSLPAGFETQIGEDGVRLSGGQRQRVAIARALYQDPAVLVFDEATASLDNQTEREVTRAIAALHGQRTMIVIAHRLTTVEGCDRLIFLKDGRVAAVGRYDELLQHPQFRAMASL